MPLARPITAATASAVSTAGTTLPLWPAMIPPASTLVRLATNGTERSRLPTRMTRVCPIAMKPRMLVRGEQRGDVAGAEEVAAVGRGEDRADDDAEHQHDRDDAGRGEREPAPHAAPVRRRRWPAGARPPRSEPAGSSPATRPSLITRIRSDMPITSGSSLETIRTATPCAASDAHQLVDRVLGADVDAAGRLVHQHDARPGGQPAGEHDLLLVAAGEELRPPGPSPARRRRARRAGRAPRGGRRRCGAGRPRGPRRARCRGSVWLSARPVALRSSVIIASPARIAARASAAGTLRSPTVIVPRVRGRTPKTASSSSVRPEPCSPARPTISPARSVRSTPSTYPLPASASSQQRLADLGALELVGEERGDRAADHQPHQLRVVELGGRAGGDLAAVLEHGDDLAEVEDLLDPVRDVEDRDAAGGEPLDDRVEQRRPRGRRAPRSARPSTGSARRS